LKPEELGKMEIPCFWELPWFGELPKGRSMPKPNDWRRSISGRTAPAATLPARRLMVGRSIVEDAFGDAWDATKGNALPILYKIEIQRE